MPWMKFEASTGSSRHLRQEMSEEFRTAVRLIRDTPAMSAAALYREHARDTFYLSPLAAKLMAPESTFPWSFCPRPEPYSVEVHLGDSGAYDTAWVELSDEGRAASQSDSDPLEESGVYWTPAKEVNEGDVHPNLSAVAGASARFFSATVYESADGVPIGCLEFAFDDAERRICGLHRQWGLMTADDCVSEAEWLSDWVDDPNAAIELVYDRLGADA